ncbi:MAG: hypothetical protein J7513_04205 [Solirubrobacteraceae bacterium]|nr:hypothetical protein [Solirubrobacteraceae bacterium]
MGVPCAGPCPGRKAAPARAAAQGYAPQITDGSQAERAAEARRLARSVESGRQIAAALRHLDAYGSEEASRPLAEALGRFLVDRAEARHAGWRVVRQLIVESASDAPWERCARRAVPLVADELIRLTEEAGRTPLHRAQHVAARCRATAVAPFVDPAPVLRDLGLEQRQMDDDEWAAGLREAVSARSREGARKRLATSLELAPAAVEQVD